MTNTKFLLLASACLLLSGNSQASEVKNLTFGYSGSPLVKTHTTHIHTPYELKPISLFNMDKAVKLAAVRSIVDKGNYDSGLTFGSSDIDTKLDPANQCAESFILGNAVLFGVFIFLRAAIGIISGVVRTRIGKKESCFTRSFVIAFRKT